MTDMSSMDLFKLNNKTALITGGAGFLGLKHAEAILDAGGRAVLLDINQELIDRGVKNLKEKYGEGVWGYVVDITDENKINDCVNKITSEIGEISILINNAANNPHVTDKTKNFSRVETFPLLTWQDDLNVGLLGSFLMSKIVGMRMVERGGGVILNIASDLGVIAPDQRIYRVDGLEENDQPVKPVTYSVTKHGLIGLTKYFATYWPEKNIRVNSVSFGGVSRGQNQDFVKKLSKLIPLGRMANEDEYKGVIIFLCSDASSYMTGSNLIVDGGRTCW